MSDNSFGSDPVQSTKKKFGMLGFIVNSVKFESGASYSVPGILDRNQNLREFKGKRLLKAGEKASAGHVIVVMRSTNKDGKEYTMWRDCTTLASDKAWVILQKSLKVVFGKNYAEVVKPTENLKSVTWLPCAIEEVPTGEKFEGTDGEVEKTGWKIAEWFENENGMRAAEKEHFARFGSSNGSHSTIPADVIAQAKQVFALVKNEETLFKQIAEKDAKYSQYPVDQLLAAIR